MGEIGEELLPALQLATMFISHPSSLEWFTHVFYGEPIRPTNDAKMLVDPSPSQSPDSMHDVQETILILGSLLVGMSRCAC
jgi:hypothetical protein